MKTFSGVAVLLFYMSVPALAKRVTLDGYEYEQVDDMLYPITKDRFMARGMKYPVVNGTPTVFYAIDPSRFNMNTTIRMTLDDIERLTCLKFVQVGLEEQVSKLVYYFGGGCSSPIGYTGYHKQHVSLGNGCDFMGVVAHETMHSLGFEHTQGRPDRDDNIKVFQENLDPNWAFNYNMNRDSDTYGTVYDFSSTMHYLPYFFALPGTTAFISVDPTHLNYLIYGGLMRYSEAFIINTRYDCFAAMGKTCKEKPNCLNGGFVTNACACICPQNFTGSACETYAGPWFKPGEQDRKYTEPGVYLTTGYPFENPKEENLNWFVFTKCFFSRMMIVSEDLVEDWWDEVSARYDTSYEYKNLIKYKNGDIVNGNSHDLVIKHANRHFKPGRGIEVAVDFIPNGKCEDSYTEFSLLFCHKRKTKTGYTYETPNYPSGTERNMACRLMENFDETKLQSLRLTLDYNLNAGERLEITHGHQGSLSLVGPIKASTFFVTSYPIDLKYKANNDNPGSFSLTSTDVYVPEICGAVTNVTAALAVPMPFVRRYPKCVYPDGVMCNMLFKGDPGKQMSISFQFDTLKANETLIVYTNYKDRTATSYLVTAQRAPITINSNMMLVSYRLLGKPDFSKWNITITPV